MFTGGRTDSHADASSETFWFNSITEMWSPGPTLNLARCAHGCGIIKDSNQVYLIVAGGWNGTNLFDSTEILELGSN